MLLLALAATAAQTPNGVFVRDDLLRVLVFAEKPLPAESSIKPGRIFYSQTLTGDGYVEFLDQAKEQEARRKYDIDMSTFFSPTEWIGVLPTGSLHHRGWVFCVKRSQYGAEKCFQDANNDGKFDHLTVLDPKNPDRLLIFKPITEISYKYSPKERKSINTGIYRQPEVSLF